MTDLYANDFSQIPTALAKNDRLRRRVVALVAAEPVVGKSTQEPSRLAELREILRELTLGEYNIRRVEVRLPPHTSRHGHDRRVFARGWAERLVRTQYSRFYNQAVLVPRSPSQDHSTNCSRTIAGRVHRVDELLRNLVTAYANGDFSPSTRIPEHPHCTHVVRPILKD